MPAYKNSMDKGVSTCHDLLHQLERAQDACQRRPCPWIPQEHAQITGLQTGRSLTGSPPLHDLTTHSVKASILVGLDMLMAPNNYQQFINIMIGHVNSNVIPMSKIDDAIT
ncbi:hypothetical protein VPH35_053764 [Triticum aestivum]|uniref:Uncharacterized protein n=1 Tax=Triticum turgidum subsp. durum TaxID=4567 RepID=A0A9R1QQB6_TRITD|nr:unnamed protein product [Triticum turgidum subsp. durum]